MKTSAVVLTLLFSVPAFADSGSNQSTNQVWITDVIIVSPESLDHIGKGSVLIENGRIARVERSKKAKKPAGATIISGNGQYLIPGLIDSHVHLASVPGMSFDQSEGKQKIVQKYFQQLPRSYLHRRHLKGRPCLWRLSRRSGDRHAKKNGQQRRLHEISAPSVYDCSDSRQLPRIVTAGQALLAPE